MEYKEYHEIEYDHYGGDIIIRCPFEMCHARVIPLATVRGTEILIQNSPDMLQIKDNHAVPTPTNGNIQFYKVNDVWDFDNIGVSKPANDLKQPIIKDSQDSEPIEFKIERLLVCSECDKGPLGFAGHQDNNTDVKSLKYFLSCKSVLYEVRD
ncbi:Mss4-like protein [Hyphopichia burtonii NRRL Y-1933]|uniref:Mss4-like protein n=1 Tax=Hyphopichia burtonii NRRL Y-1933 TaxID=984485 RepID=A0A1E4RJB0_9ASCO|nr:Mss4-like protein [Hyphopichia burtonii NRRL Y-1933]ODV67175.1 Mss4-like protein [Hyphopichia burtonii NRRL Y-1933]